jgi:PAS domain S-box-containing protein
MNSSPDATDGNVFGDADDAVSRRRDRTMLEAVADGIYRLDPDLTFVAVDDQFVATTGHPRDELLGSHVSLVLGPDDVERLEDALAGERDSLDAIPLDLSVRTACGRTTECTVWVSPLSTDADPRGAIGVVRHDAATPPDDVSLETRDVLSTALKDTQSATFVLDDAFEVVWVNQSVGRYFGIDAAELVGRDKRQVVQDTMRGTVADPAGFANRVLATYDDNTYFEKFPVHVTAGDGREERWLEHYSNPITSGQYAGGRVERYTDISERKQSIDARRETEAEFRSLVDAVKEYAIFSLSPDGIVTSWNEGAKAIKGYQAEEILGEHISTFYTSEDRAAGVPERNLEIAAETGSVDDEGWRVRKDGSRFWANVTITAVRDEDGNNEGFLKVTRDMTEQHEHQKGLESELHNILDRVSDGFVGLDEDWRFSYVNDRAAELMDVCPERAMGEVIWDLFPDVLDTLYEEEYRRAMREQVVVSFEEFFPPLESWFEVSAYPSETGLSVYFRDVTERRKRREAVRERERELEAHKNFTDDILNTIDDLFYVIDRRGCFQRWNETVRSVTGYSDEEIEAMEPLEIIVEEDREQVARTIGETFRTGTARVEAEIKAKDGYHVPMEFVASAVKTPGDEPMVTFIGRDMTERKRRQRQLEESNERLEQFAYAASHDLQEPLRMVSSYLRLIEDRYADVIDEDGQEFLDFAVDGADRMRDMIDGLLAYSRIESEGDSFERVDLNVVLENVQESLQMLCDEQDADITATALPAVEGDRGQLRQLFQNLLENAIMYSGDEPPRIEVFAERQCDQWLVSVRDEGVGIDPSDTDRIFEVFQSLGDGKQSGIGLALCKRIVERHDGELHVDSTLGEGSTFSFTLPAAGDDDD